jgi:predicted metal-dependent peptidase
MSSEIQLIEDEIARAAFDLLLQEPFYAHVLAGMPRVITEEVRSLGLQWTGNQVVLRVNPTWFQNHLGAAQRKVALKHEVLHVVFRHLFRPGGRDPEIFSIAADLVVNQLLAPLKPLPDWPTLAMFPELNLKPDQPVEAYYAALVLLLRKMREAGFRQEQENGGEAWVHGGTGENSVEAPASRTDWAQGTGMPRSAKSLAGLLKKSTKRGDDAGWHDGTDGLGSAAGRYAVGSIVIRASERTPPHQWGTFPAGLLSELGLILAEREPKLDWKRVVRIFCASSGSTRIRHTVKRVSKRYGTRPGIKVKRLQRLLVALDTSGSIDQNMLEAFFSEIHAAWKAGATVHVVECDADVQSDYRYVGKPPHEVSGGGGTKFEPVFRWMREQRPFDGCLYLTDGCGPPPSTRPPCRLLWVIAGNADIGDDENTLPFGSSISLPVEPT